MSGNARAKITFPCRWEFRLIALSETLEATRQAVTAIDGKEHAGFDIAPGETSGGGRFTALRVSCMVDSAERAKELAALLAQAEGVRFIF